MFNEKKYDEACAILRGRFPMFFAAIFVDLWSKLPQVDFIESWMEGSAAYLNGARKAVVKAACTFTGNGQRKGFLIPSLEGTFVLLQRYTDNNEVVVCNSPVRGPLFTADLLEWELQIIFDVIAFGKVQPEHIHLVSDHCNFHWGFSDTQMSKEMCIEQTEKGLRQLKDLGWL